MVAAVVIACDWGRSVAIDDEACPAEAIQAVRIVVDPGVDFDHVFCREHTKAILRFWNQPLWVS